MKAKNLMRISLFVAVLCLMLVVTALADAKIINFTQTGIGYTATYSNADVFAVTTSQDGDNTVVVDRMTLVANTDITGEQYKATYAPNKQFYADSYPYIKVKFRTDWQNVLQYYIPVENGYFFYPLDGVENYNNGEWHEVELYLGANPPQEAQALAKMSELDSQGNHAASGTFSDAVVKQTFILAKNGDNTGENGCFFELEYIAFFDNCAEMQAYHGLDGKIIRFDGFGNTEYSIRSSYDYETEDGVLRVTGSVYGSQFYIDAVGGVDVSEYPYMTVSYKLNDSEAFKTPYGSTQLYLYTSDDANAESTTPTAYYDVERSFYDLNKSHKLVNYIGVETPAEGVPNGKFTDCATNKKYIRSLRIEPSKKYRDRNYYDDAVTEVEYVAFFKNLEDAVAYGAPSEIVLNGASGFTHKMNSPANANITADNDGTYRIEGMSAPNDYQPEYSLNAPYAGYMLTDYPYIKVKYNTMWDAITQFYLYTLEEYKDYLYKGLGTTGGGDSVFSFDIGSNSRAGACSDPNEFLAPMSAAAPEVKLGDAAPFFQFKGSTTADDLYAEIAYVAYFKTAAERDAFGAAETKAVIDAYDALNEGTLECTVHPAAPFEKLDQTIKKIVEETYSGVYATVYVDATEGDTTGTANILIDNMYADEALSVTVNLSISYVDSPITFNNPGASIRIDTLDETQATRYTDHAMRFRSEITYDADVYTVVAQGAVIGRGDEPVLYTGDTDYHTAAVNVRRNNTTYFDTVITRIPLGQLDTEITVRPYIIYEMDGVEHIYYGEAIKRSVNGILAAMGE